MTNATDYHDEEEFQRDDDGARQGVILALVAHGETNPDALVERGKLDLGCLGASVYLSIAQLQSKGYLVLWHGGVAITIRGVARYYREWFGPQHDDCVRLREMAGEIHQSLVGATDTNTHYTERRARDAAMLLRVADELETARDGGGVDATYRDH